MSEKHNGYTNYETWVVHLWISNNEIEQDFYEDLTISAYMDSEDTKYLSKNEEARRKIVESLKGIYEEEIDGILEKSNTRSTVWSDLIEKSISNVNWHEIADHMLEDFVKVEA